MSGLIKVRNEPAQRVGVVNSAPCPEMNIIAKEITENGTYTARAEGVTGFDPVIVNVPSREEIGYENGYAAGYSKGSTDGYADALSKRTELEVTANGEYVPEGESTGFSKVSVNLPSDADTIDGLIDGTLSGAYRNDRVTKVGGYGFYNQKNLTSIDLPNLTLIDLYGMGGCTALTSANLPKVTTFGMYAISGCNKLTTINLPLLKSISSYAFSGCSELPYVSLPSATSISQQCFQSNRKLEYIYIPKALSIQTSAFLHCYSLKTIILGGTQKITLSNTNAFQNCYHILGTADATYNPEGLKDGYIYIPDDLVEESKVATNWSIYASQIMPKVNTVNDLSRIDTTLYDHACVDFGNGTFTEYYFNGAEWEVFVR